MNELKLAAITPVLGFGIFFVVFSVWLFHPQGYSKGLTEDQRAILTLVYLLTLAGVSLALFIGIAFATPGI